MPTRETGLPAAQVEKEDNWDRVREDYIRISRMPYFPDASFRKVRKGEIIDEDKSVRWNREEAARLNEAYTKEVKRLNRERSLDYSKVINRIIRLIAEDADITEEKAEILWDFIYVRHHSYGEMFDVMDDYIELASEMAKPSTATT